MEVARLDLAVRDVAARPAGHEDLEPDLRVCVQQRHARPGLGRAQGGGEAGGAGTDDDDTGGRHGLAG